MKTQIKALTICGTIFTITAATSVQAGVTETDGLGNSWIGSPTFVTSPTVSTFTTAEGNFGTGGANNFGALAQTFDLTTAGVLQNFQFVFSGAVETNSIELFDLGAYPASGYPSTSASYNPSIHTSLLSAGDQFVYNGGAGGASSVAEVTLSDADANITLQANELYALEIDPTATAAQQWVRDGQLAVNGQAYRANGTGLSAINGSIRDFGFAVTVSPVPEPGILAMAGLGGILGLMAIRRRKS